MLPTKDFLWLSKHSWVSDYHPQVCWSFLNLSRQQFKTPLCEALGNIFPSFPCCFFYMQLYKLICCLWKRLTRKDWLSTVSGPSSPILDTWNWTFWLLRPFPDPQSCCWALPGAPGWLLRNESEQHVPLFWSQMDCHGKWATHSGLTSEGHTWSRMSFVLWFLWVKPAESEKVIWMRLQITACSSFRHSSNGPTSL